MHCQIRIFEKFSAYWVNFALFHPTETSASLTSTYARCFSPLFFNWADTIFSKRLNVKEIPNLEK